MKSFQQYQADVSQVEELSEEDLLTVFEMARDTEYHTQRDLQTDDNDFDKQKPKPVVKKTIIQVRDKHGAVVRSYHDPKRFQANMAMHKNAGHTFHRVVA